MTTDKYSAFPREYANIPGYTQQQLEHYVRNGTSTGGFVQAVFENDLQGAFGAADLENLRALEYIVKWVYNVSPTECWGNKEKVKAWRAQHGLVGLQCQTT